MANVHSPQIGNNSNNVDITQSHAPSHILADGRFVILPDPSPAERRRFMERSIARHGLLQEDLEQLQFSKTEDSETAAVEISGGKEDGDEESKSEDETARKVHPLLLASARLQNNGINELNRAINLAALVQTGEYFGLSNIVADSALELAATEAEASKSGTDASQSKEKTSSSAQTATAASTTTPASATKSEIHECQRVAATYVLRRKYAQFRQAALLFEKHRDRLESAIVAEHRPLNRLRRLRRQWRLVAPEHGTRAAPHAPRPTEVLAADVDLYHSSQPGRLARRVPRYATVELKDNYQVDQDKVQWKKKMKNLSGQSGAGTPKSQARKRDYLHFSTDGDVVMKDPADHSEEKEIASDVLGTEEDYSESALWTKAEPFAIADPTLGKIDADFDPSKVAMLTLEFLIEKPGSIYRTSACLEPFAVNTTVGDNLQDASDILVLVALQHSLFCSKMFDSIRREVASDTQEVGQVRSAASQSEKSTIWISSSVAATTSEGSEMANNHRQFLPPPGSMVRGDLGLGEPVSVIHCHEGEVMVQLDCEYTLCIKLVEAAAQSENNDHSEQNRYPQESSSVGSNSANSYLLVLCQALMFHAQEIYHKYMLRQEKIQRQQEEEEIAANKPNSGLAMKRKAPEKTSPRILQECTCLGAKMLMERRIRSMLATLEQWVLSKQQEQRLTSATDSKSRQPLQLQSQWLPLSALDSHAQLVLSLTGTGWFVDVHLHGDRMTVTSFDPNSASAGGYRKVDFYSVEELELFLKRAVWDQIRQRTT